MPLTYKFLKIRRKSRLLANHKQLFFADTFDNVQDFYQNDKPRFLQLLDEYLDLTELVPKSFEDSYYRY